MVRELLDLVQYILGHSVGDELCPLLCRRERGHGIFHKLFVVHWAVTTETNHAWYSSLNEQKKIFVCSNYLEKNVSFNLLMIVIIIFFIMCYQYTYLNGAIIILVQRILCIQ